MILRISSLFHLLGISSRCVAVVVVVIGVLVVSEVKMQSSLTYFPEIMTVHSQRYRHEWTQFMQRLDLTSLSVVATTTTTTAAVVDVPDYDLFIHLIDTVFALNTTTTPPEMTENEMTEPGGNRHVELDETLERIREHVGKLYGFGISVRALISIVTGTVLYLLYRVLNNIYLYIIYACMYMWCGLGRFGMFKVGQGMSRANLFGG